MIDHDKLACSCITIGVIELSQLITAVTSVLRIVLRAFLISITHIVGICVSYPQKKKKIVGICTF